MFEATSAAGGMAIKKVAAGAAIVVLGGALGGYAIHEHNTAQNLEVKNQQATAALDQTRHQLDDLTSKVNTLVAKAEAPAPPAAPAVSVDRPVKPRPAVRREDPRFKKLQSQLEAQGKAIEDTRSQIASTQGDLANTRTELTGSIAHTHDELVLLQKRGERNYTEFDLSKSKQYEHKGPFGMRLKKANEKHQYADMELIVDDRNLSQKHINLYQPVMFYTPDSPQPVEVVINNISKDHVHGYVSAPKYRQSELTSMAQTSTTPGTEQTATTQPGARQKLVPQPQ
ncbi:hypothetical protein DYQ86_06945 [Acidobacteria bacterium AB60]|nr:hypothetical protein DYQ86_06945 [Acidobacteria bacterium AB60]